MPEEDPQFVMPPKTAARELGIAASTLRRLAPTYEAVHGPLPWEGDEAGGGRLWPAEAVTRVREARALVEEGRAKSLERALRALVEGAPPAIGVLARPDDTGEVAALREEVAELRQQLSQLADLPAKIEALERSVATSRALPPGATPASIDQALEVEAREGSAPPERLPTSENGGAGVERPGDDEVRQAHSTDGPGAADGLLVRAARWVEGLLRR